MVRSLLLLGLDSSLITRRADVSTLGRAPTVRLQHAFGLDVLRSDKGWPPPKGWRQRQPSEGIPPTSRLAKKTTTMAPWRLQSDRGPG